MNLKQLAIKGGIEPAPQFDTANFERCLALLAEGAASNVPEIEESSFHSFRESVISMARQITEQPQGSDLMPAVKAIVREFEGYRKSVDNALRLRQAGWRALAEALLRDLLHDLGIDPASASAAPLVAKVGALSTAEQIQTYRALLEEFLHPRGDESIHTGSSLRTKDRSTANDNAAGLLGGGAAQEHLGKILEREGKGFVVLFRMGCLDVIGERFGMEAVHDSVMTVSAYLTQSLRSADAVYHWSDTTLLAILESPATEQMISAAMQRVANNNRDITIKIGGRNVMLRIPVSYELIPIARFRSAEDLLKLSREPGVRR